jgi:hypothetical protein
MGYTNGATALLSAKINKIPRSRSAKMIGASHHFFLSIKNWNKSFKKSIGLI